MRNIMALIISGGELEEEFLLEFIKNKQIDYIIAVDRGLEVLDKIHLEPNYIIGDFDSVNRDILKKDKYSKTQIIKLNPEKDYSDTHMALKLALDLNSEIVYIIGAMGKRIDHALANIHILKEALEKRRWM